MAKMNWQDTLCTSIMLLDFHHAAIDKILGIPELEEQLKQDTWKGGGAPLHFAAALGRGEVMEKLIKKGCKVNR